MKKSLLFFVIVAIVYEIVIRSTNVWWTIGQNQWHANRIIADKFLFRSQDYPNIMVGSSMAARLTGKIPQDSLPPGLYNLSMSGQSVFDGLLILKKSGYVPRNLYIETNVITRDEDQQFQSSLFSPLIYNLKRFVKSWRDSYQPVELLFRFRPRKPTDAELVNLPQPARDERSYKTMLAVQIQKNKEPLNDSLLQIQVQKLKELVVYFQQKGTRVTLFSMPVDGALCGSRRNVQLRTAVEKTFEPLHCDIIALPDCNDYITTDGTHLDVPSVYKYLHYLRNAIGSRSLAAPGVSGNQ